MRFEREGGKTIENPSLKVLERELRKLRSFGPSSFASLTRVDGSYIQVGGGGVTCVVERRDSSLQRQFRARQQTPVVPFEDGTELRFAGSAIKLDRGEWFRIDQVIELFAAFLEARPPKIEVQWRDISDVLDL